MPIAVPALDSYWSNLSGLFIFFVICQFIYPFSQVVSQIIHEKSDKIKEGMKMMGVTVATYWTSWYIWLFIEATIITLLVVIVGVVGDVYKWSDPTLMFLWIWLFMINLYSFGTLFSCFFDNPKIAALSAFIVYIVVMLASLFANNLTESEKTWLCLLGPSCFSLSVENMAQYESSLIGIQWDNLYETYKNFKFGTCLSMLFVDTIIYILLTLYFDRVWPSRFGQRLHPLFFVSPSFWCPNRQRKDGSTSPLDQKLLRQ